MSAQIDPFVWQSRLANYPILEKIALCESGGNHFDVNGEVLRGRKNSQDIGLFQINLFYHQSQAEKLGLNLFTEQDNITYALWLYNQQGTRPWLASAQCWRDGKSPAY